MSESDPSAPLSPASTLEDAGFEDVPSNGLRLELAPFGLERVFDYEPGGHHPVHLGDYLGDNHQYRIIHKLGTGGFANIWLCRDITVHSTTKYFALKILMSELSTGSCPELLVGTLLGTDGDGANYIAHALDRFRLHGPNGSHLCFVYPVLGPKVSLGLYEIPPNQDEILRSMCHQVVEAMDYLHSHGICHGDFTASNILHRISGLDGLTETEVLRVFGAPRQNKVIDEEGQPPSEPTAPKYLVYPVRWGDVDPHYIANQACLIDFGECFKASHPPDDLGTPGPYRSPELILDRSAGIASDLWALGCTLFEIRTGRKLISPFGDEDDDYLESIVLLLGRLPEPWWSTTWKERKRLFKDEADALGHAVPTTEPPSIGVRHIVHPSVADGAKSLQDKLAPGLWYMSDERIGGDFHRDIQPEEVELFADLLSKLLDLRPEGRLKAGAALDHAWFKL